MLVLLVAITAAVIDGWRAFGHRATGARQARAERSPEWQGGHFENPQPMWNGLGPTVEGALHASPDTSPLQPTPTVATDPKELAVPPASGLRVTWLGHATILVEIDGVRVLTDPVWSERASPFTWAGPKRFHAPPIALASLPHVDAVVISHDHYDHLDYATIVAMKDWDTTFIVPLGVGAHLAYWGVPESRIVEHDWWERTKIGAVDIVSTPSRHATGRSLFDYGSKLWSGYAFVGPQHRAYYAGDTGLFPALRDIGERLGPFDVTMIEIGQYGQGWPDWHLGPEQAMEANQRVKGRLMVPVHWATFALAYHGWTEPIERALVAAKAAGVTLAVPEPGQSFEPSSPPAVVRWWPSLPWKTAAEDPIVASKAD
jgi:L-ascorbate metabolism protein UlaG (beta-lactamase superfamily)